jgi:hypothetical protein
MPYPLPYGILPAHLRHVSLPVDSIRARGCEWLVDGIYCRRPCVPFLFVCQEHKDIPDLPRGGTTRMLHNHTLLRRRTKQAL